MARQYMDDERYVRPRRRKRHRGRDFLFLMLLVALVLIAYKVTSGFTGAGTDVSVPMENIKTEFDIDLDALAKQADAAKGDFSPSQEDISALKSTAFKHIKYKKKIDFFIDHIRVYDQTAVNTILLSPEKTDFALLAPFAEETPTGSWDISTQDGKIPYFIQFDSRWAFHHYGSSCVGNTACGPTCIAMAAVGLTGDTKYTPDYVSDYAENRGYYVVGAGTAWSFYTDGASGLGLKGEVISASESEMKARLDNGEVLIVSVNPGDFTMAGHFIVIHGYNSTGFKVYDPSSLVRSGKIWGFDTLSTQMAQVWSMSKA